MSEAELKISSDVCSIPFISKSDTNDTLCNDTANETEVVVTIFFGDGHCLTITPAKVNKESDVCDVTDEDSPQTQESVATMDEDQVVSYMHSYVVIVMFCLLCICLYLGFATYTQGNTHTHMHMHTALRNSFSLKVLAICSTPFK